MRATTPAPIRVLEAPGPLTKNGLTISINLEGTERPSIASVLALCSPGQVESATELARVLRDALDVYLHVRNGGNP